MIQKAIDWIKKHRGALWVKPAFGSVFAVAAALLAAVGNRFLPPNFVPVIERETVDSLLTIIASSMLAISTFSLSIMVSAFASAASSATPRATKLVMRDEGTQTAIASFISAFVFSVIAKVALGLGYYGASGRFVLFLSTVVVLIYLIVTLLKWVNTLSELGRIDNTIKKVEKASLMVMRAYRQLPNLGAMLVAPSDEDGATGMSVLAGATGYINDLKLADLQAVAESHDLSIHIRVRVGSYVFPDTVVATLSQKGVDAKNPITPKHAKSIRSSFVIGDIRLFEQDPRFGLLVLSEIAQRALSPAVNDPGTAISVMNAIARVLVDNDPEAAELEREKYTRLSVVDLDTAEFLSSSFDPIARDGAGHVEVQVRLQAILAGIGRNIVDPSAGAVESVAASALKRALSALSLSQDRQDVQEAFDKLRKSLNEPSLKI